MSNILPFRK